MEIEELATSGLLLAGGAVHAFPDELTQFVDDDFVPQIEVPVTLQRTVGVASMGAGVLEAMEALDEMR